MKAPSHSGETGELEREALAAFDDLMNFYLMAKWSADGRQDFAAVFARAKAARSALATPNDGGRDDAAG
jgi:hypothetical protein